MPESYILDQNLHDGTHKQVFSKAAWVILMPPEL